MYIIFMMEYMFQFICPHIGDSSCTNHNQVCYNVQPLPRLVLRRMPEVCCGRHLACDSEQLFSLKLAWLGFSTVFAPILRLLTGDISNGIQTRFAMSVGEAKMGRK